MRNLDSRIVKIQKIMGVRNLITEASKKDVLVNKLGLKEEHAEFFDRTCGGLSVMIFKKYLRYIFQFMKNSPGEEFTTLTEKEVIEALNRNSSIPANHKQRIQSIMDWVRVGLNGRLNQYQDSTFSELYDKSEEWHNSLNLGQGDINYKEENTIIKDFRDADGNGFYWVDLNTNTSDEECKRMGHCGRTGSNNNLYSLRENKKIPGGKFTLNKSHLTSSIGNDGILYQLKGPKNSKPQEEFHQYILPLFFVLGGRGEQEDYLIQGFGSEYASNLDFKITDLPDDTIKELYTQRPELFESYSLRSKLKEMGLIEMPGLQNFVLSIDAHAIDRYVDGDWLIGKRKWTDAQGVKRESKTYFFETLLTDPWDLWQNYNSDWESAVDYNLNKENEKKIRDYLISLAENPSEYEESSTKDLIENLDEEFDVRNAISEAVNQAESDDYTDTLRKHLESKLEEYGTVLKLNDEGAEIQINLQSFVDQHVDNDEWLLECLDTCGETNSECIFDEVIGDYGFEKPRWNFDDRYYPDVDSRFFNDMLSDRLSDFIR
jgi:hypothetical protein